MSKAKTKSLLALWPALLALALFAAPAQAAEGPTHAFLFSLHGETKEPGHVPIPPPEGNLEDACGVALDSAGDIYLADYYHHTIDVYSPAREYLTQLADPDPDGPCNLAVDSAGRLYVNHWHRDVARFTPSEFPPTAATRYGSETTIDDGHGPDGAGQRSTGVAVDPASGRIYVDDRNYVAVYEPSGAPAEVAGQPLEIGLGSLGAGYGVAVSDFPATAGYVYVADASEDTVKAYAPGEAANPIRTIDGAGSPQHGFNSLADSDLALDSSDGHLYVADNLEPGFQAPAAVVDEFNPQGFYRGQLPHAFVDAEPTALAVDGAGEVYATDGNTEAAGLDAFGPTLPAATLAVSKTGAGAGTVGSEPFGIDCGSACAAEFNTATKVVLFASPAPGSEFAGWSGAGCSGPGFCKITLAAATEVSAEFTLLPPQPLALQAAALGPAAPDTALATPTSNLKAAPNSDLRRHRHRRSRHRHHADRAGRKGRRRFPGTRPIRLAGPSPTSELVDE